MYYFAYGSNINERHLHNYLRKHASQYKCNIVGVAVLDRYKLSFMGIKRCSNIKAKATVEPCKTSKVYGIIYDICQTTKKILDKKEGLRTNIYKTFNVVANHDKKYKCLCYCMTEARLCNKITLPSIYYITLIINGAKKHKFPINYINKLLVILNKLQTPRLEIQ